MSAAMREEMRAAIARVMGVPVEQCVDTARFRDLGADSLDVLECVMDVEQDFAVSIPDNLRECLTVGDLLRVALQSPKGYAR